MGQVGISRKTKMRNVHLPKSACQCKLAGRHKHCYAPVTPVIKVAYISQPICPRRLIFGKGFFFSFFFLNMSDDGHRLLFVALYTVVRGKHQRVKSSPRKLHYGTCMQMKMGEGSSWSRERLIFGGHKQITFNRF